MQSILSTGMSKAERARRTSEAEPPFQAGGPPPHKLAFTLKEATRASGLSRSLLYIAIGRGELHARKCGARTLILESDLRRFLRRLPRLTKSETNAEADA
jgi:hypothetical protein